MEMKTKLNKVVIAAAAICTVAASSVYAQANEQFVPVLVYRTGAYAPNGVPWANGFVDYLTVAWSVTSA